MLINFIVATAIAGTPLLLGTLGEILSEKVGHLNLGVEGMMAIGACAGFMTGYFTDNFFLAILTAFLAGALSGGLYALLTVTLMVNQNVIGLALTIFGVGLSNALGVYVINFTNAGSLKLPEQITEEMRSISLPILSSIPVLGPLLFQYTPFVYLALILAFGLEFWLKKTRIGLNLRAIGENPEAADAAGIAVNYWKYGAIMMGGGICGIGGVYCAFIINSGVWISDVIGGIGWISVALVIFASWDCVGAILGSIIFGALRVLKYYISTSIFPVPNAFYDMLPFLMTALILIFASMKKKKKQSMPQNLGENYFREDR